jgi:hypothetical protein
MIFTAAAITCLYLLFAASSFWVMRDMHSPAHSQVMTATQELPQADFARFWYVGKRLVIQRAADFGHAMPQSPWFQAAFKIDILSPAVPPRSAWLYPPTMGVLAMLFSSAPLAASFWLWEIFSLAAAAFLLRTAGLGWLVIAAGLASPAGLQDLIAGQNGALLAGLFVSSLLCFDTKPKLSGVLAGLLCIKPQAAIALPMILLQRRRHKALRWCLFTGLAIAALSILLEGWQSWAWFFDVAEPASARLLALPFNKLPLGGVTVMMMARSLHASLATAWALQAVSSATAAILIWMAWARPVGDAVRRMALTACLAALLTPYGYMYDLVGFSIAMAAMFALSPAALKPVFALLWLSGGYTGTLEKLTGFVLMPVAAALGAWLIWRGLSSASGATAFVGTDAHWERRGAAAGQ